MGSIIPEFQDTLTKLRMMQLKYSTLTNRLSTPLNSQLPTVVSMHGTKIRESLLNDKFARKLNITDDIIVGRNQGSFVH